MSFFKNLFRKKDEPKGEPFIPTPTQDIPGLEPIVVQAIENLYLDAEGQKHVFNYSLEFNKIRKGDTLGAIALLAYSKGIIEKLPDPKLWTLYQFWMDEIAPIFPNMKAAEEWVTSITKLQV